MKSSVFRRVVLGAMFVSSAAMAAPFASAPSMAPVGRAIEITGGGFQPGALITVRVAGPGNAVSVAAVVVAADGRLAHTLTATQDGAHRVQLLQADGREAVPAMLFQASR
ncbi:MAG TPA: hypothetical protein PK306_17820 [Aquabacterium sp.]|nr:hypothetical protein [Aquabacterium sp.]HQC97563.1 hypothetical protein [Aquabacterium sp.]